MKEIFLFFTLSLLLLISACSKPEPVSCFDAAISDSLALEYTFENCSENGETYMWSFGDGDTSSRQNPIHLYTEGGIYDVTLSVTGSDEENVITATQSIEVIEPFTFGIYSGNEKTEATKNAKFNLDVLAYEGIESITAHHISGNYQERVYKKNFGNLTRDTFYTKEILMPFVFRDSSRYRFTLEDVSGATIEKDVVMAGNAVDSTQSDIEISFQSGSPAFDFTYEYGYAEEIKEGVGTPNMAINLFDTEGDRIRLENFTASEGTKLACKVTIEDSENDRVIEEIITTGNGQEALNIENYDGENRLVSGFFAVNILEGTADEDLLTIRFSEVIMGMYKEG